MSGKDGTCDIGAYEFAPPTVTGVTPNNGPPAGGNSATITGVGFTFATGLAFGGQAVSLPAHTDSSITVTVPTGPAGTVDVTVWGPDGHSATSSADHYTFNAPTPPRPPGYDLVGSDEGVFVFPTNQPSGFFGSLPGLGVRVSNIVSIMPTPDGHGYWLIGSEGGIFAFGDAASLGSLPGLGVSVNNVVGAVPTG